MNAGGQFGPGSARGHRAQFREIRTQSDFDGQSQRAGGRAPQGDPLRSVRMPCPFHDDVRIRASVGGRAQRPHEASAVGREHPGLNRERFAAGDPDLAPGEHPPSRAVEALQPPAGQLPLIRGDHQSRQGNTDQGSVGGWQVHGPGRCGQRRLGSPGAACRRGGGPGAVPCRARVHWAASTREGLRGPVKGRTVAVGGRGRGGQGHGAVSSALRAPWAHSAPGGGSGGSGALRRRGPATVPPLR